MDRKAVIENCDYHLLETVPSLTGQELFVLYEDGDGNKFVCPEAYFVKSSAAICVVGSIRPEEEKQGIYGADC